MSLLAALNKAGALRALDHALAQSLRRLDPDTPDAVLAAAALASLAVAHGHAGFDPARPTRLVEAALPWPDAQGWIAQLQASPWVARPDDDVDEATQAPLAWEHGLLYLRRYREYERRLALGLQRIGQAPLQAADPAALAPLFAQLFPGNAAAAPGTAARQGDLFAQVPAAAAAASTDASPAGDQQARAAALALRHALLLVTGGPGTGKTTTIARLLVLLAAQAQAAGRAPPRV
ncbi:MAG: exodeoxyribonuclease V subunit alpha, partial [Stenotrophomonas sp.]|nr:exodeoxyribonuclease V subunit alpha [Stenotrophomonas sp.]